MSIGSIEQPGIAGVLSRIAEIQQQTAPPPAAGFSSALAGAGGAATPAAGTRSSMELPSLSGAAPAWMTPALGATSQAGPVAVGAGTPTGQAIARIAAQELGVAEEPSGSNDGARIAQYRSATQGGGVGPWCSYFTSWVAAQAGVPVGDRGQGLGWVPDVAAWAQSTGRWVPATSAAPAVGDLVVFDRNSDGVDDHIGVVTNVGADGGFQTVEGNSSDRVSARSYGAGQAVGFVRLG